MKTSHCVALSVIALTCAAKLHAQPPSNSKAIATIVGTWIVPSEQYTEVFRGAEFTFKANGTFTSYAIFKIEDQEVRVEVEGKWRVEKGVLIEEITKSSRKDMVPVGLITRDTLLEVTEGEYRYRSEDGQEEYHVRKRRVSFDRGAN
jgi:hypothetical protein